MKSRGEKSHRREKQGRSAKRRGQRKEVSGGRKCRKVAIHYVLNSRKRRVRSHLARWEMQRFCKPLWREASLHKFAGEKVENTSRSEHFWKLSYRKRSKKCMSLCRKARLEVKSAKNWRGRTTLWSWDVERARAGMARSTFRSQEWKKSRGSEAVLDVRMSFCALSRVSRAWGFDPSHSYNQIYITFHFSHYTIYTIDINRSTYSTLCYITLHCVHYAKLHYSTTPQLHYWYLTLYTLRSIHSTTTHAIANNWN